MSQEALINYTIGILGLILAIVGIVLTIRSIKRKEPVYSIKSVNVISDYTSKYQDLIVSYKNSKVESFTVSKILFYNRGSETITQQDIETINHLRIIGVDKVNILDARVLQANNPSNNFDVFYEKEPDIDNMAKKYLIDFDCIDRNQGAVIQVVHTGIRTADIKVIGDMKGVQRLVEIDPSVFRKRELQYILFRLALYIVLLVILLMFIFVGQEDATFERISIVVITALGLYIVFDFLPKLFGMVRSGMPKGLESFYD